MRDFKPLTSTFSEVRLRGEEESEMISAEINLVIRHKIEELGERLDLSSTAKLSLNERLCDIPHTTYLWLHLMFDDISKRLEFTREDIESVTKTIPRSVDEAYTAILDRSPDKGKARRLLNVILAAVRPLDVEEINVAMVVEEKTASCKDLEVWKFESAADKIKNICGLFVTIVDFKAYLIHQTARDFLLGALGNGWRHSFSLAHANLVLGRACIWFLQLRDLKHTKALVPSRPPDVSKWKPIAWDDRVPSIFLDYAASYWSTHFGLAESVAETDLIEIIAHHICVRFFPLPIASGTPRRI